MENFFPGLQSVKSLARDCPVTRRIMAARWREFLLTPKAFLSGLLAILLWAWASAITQVSGLRKIAVAPPVSDVFRSLSILFLLTPIAFLLLINRRSSPDSRTHLVLWLIMAPLAVSYAFLPAPFFDYVWDVMLLECFFVTSCSLVLLTEASVAKFATWPLRLLLFKLMFSMGVIKLVYGMTEWKTGGAMQFFWQNQPMPGLVSWYANALPGWLQKTFSWYTLFVEVPATVLIFAGPRSRKVFFWLNLLLQLGIFFSGNYAFFNLLTILLSWSLWQVRTGNVTRENTGGFFRQAARICFGIILAGWLCSSSWNIYKVLHFERGYLPEYSWVFLKNDTQLAIPSPLRDLLSVYAAPKFSAPYGLFAHIPRYRMEISIEGSYDQKAWRVYPFRVKPKECERAPTWYAPHHWRLDHQMYYESFRIRDPGLHARMSHFLGARWMPGLLTALSRADADVLQLLSENPFPDRPPHFFRLRYQYYLFTSMEEKRLTGLYWKTESTHAGQFFEETLSSMDFEKLP